MLEQIKEHWEKEEYGKCLDDLDEAFELGYVPGSEDRRWDITLVSFLDLFFHPDNKVALYGFCKGLDELESNTAPRDEYEEIPGIENISVRVREHPDFATGRKLDYQNPDKNYWLDWSRELREYI